MTGDAELADQVAEDWKRAQLDEADRAMLAFCEKLTLTPAAMEPPDVEALRAAGHDDRAIHDIVAVTAYFAFVNRIADGLGVELEDDWEERPGGVLPIRRSEL